MSNRAMQCMKAIGCALLITLQLSANTAVEKVHVIFKTHLDIGFTDLSSVVEQRYINEFIPKAIDVAEELRNSGGDERYVWTTGSWLIWAYLQKASPSQIAKLEKAISCGDIVWNGMPYTVESESMSSSHFATILQLSKYLDSKYNKKTLGAKMTDVPGHTRGIVPQLQQAGIEFLHIGVNPASVVPSVPAISRWQETDGSEIILMYQKDYGSDIVFPDGKTAMVVVFTGDNHGPHSAEQVRLAYKNLHERYPNARIIASNLNDVALDLRSMRSQLPVFQHEIGDTWIHGYGSSPNRMARFRELSRLYDIWLKEGKIKKESIEAISFAVQLGLIAEHTWGLDVKSYLQNWDKYSFDIFQASRTLPEFKRIELSWKELDDNIEKAIAFLPKKLQQEAFSKLETLDVMHSGTSQKNKSVTEDSYTVNGVFNYPIGNQLMLAGELAYQSYSADDIKRFQSNYMTSNAMWAVLDFGKNGLDQCIAPSTTLTAVASQLFGNKTQRTVQLEFIPTEGVDQRVFPKQSTVHYTWNHKKKQLYVEVELYNKPANRIPEAYWFSFYPKNVEQICIQKLGRMVDVMDVVEGGNRQMHGVDQYVEVITSGKRLRITSLDAPLVAIGERNLYNYTTCQPNIEGGIHFNLFNNVWGTNFSMWYEGNIRYRFIVEQLE